MTKVLNGWFDHKNLFWNSSFCSSSELEEQLILQVIKASISVSDYRKDENVLDLIGFKPDFQSFQYWSGQSSSYENEGSVELDLDWNESSILISVYQYLFNNWSEAQILHI